MARKLASDPERFRQDAYRKRNRTNQKKWRTNRRAVLDALKAGKPCADCKVEYPPVVMDWDHVPERGQKAFGIGRMSMFKIERILAEIAKCDLVCANCHRMRTARRRG